MKGPVKFILTIILSIFGIPITAAALPPKHNGNYLKNKPNSCRAVVMRHRLPKDYFMYFAPAIVITLAGFVIAYQFVDPAPPRQITIATGRSNGACNQIGRRFSDILARDGVTLSVKETAGAVETGHPGGQGFGRGYPVQLQRYRTRPAVESAG